VSRPRDALAVILHRAAAALGLSLPAEFVAHVSTYLDELDRWQQIGGLTAYRTRPERVRHLVLESLMLLTVLPEPTAPLLDIGSGPGVPGLIVKLARPEWPVTLVDATRRRANFLRHIVRRLELDHASVHWGRAEALHEVLGNAFQTVTMRAVAGPVEAEALAAPFLAPRGVLVLPLGPRSSDARGMRRAVTLRVGGELPWRREFLIIRRREGEADVPRGTGRADRSRHRGREPEGRGREDHHRG
jgi:16S rRNA (guanine527-N7)-methyltransferase